MEYRSNEIKAGCFVGISIILLIATLFVVSGLDLFKSTKIYHVRFKYTGGIEVGSIVRYGGMEVGTIKEVRIADDDNSRIDFVIEIAENVPVKEDSKVFITSIGIMGEYYIEISTGSANSKLVPPGSLLNSKDITPLMMLTDTVDELTAQSMAGGKDKFQPFDYNLQKRINQIRKDSIEAGNIPQEEKKTLWGMPLETGNQAPPEQIPQPNYGPPPPQIPSHNLSAAR